MDGPSGLERPEWIARGRVEGPDRAVRGSDERHPSCGNGGRRVVLHLAGIGIGCHVLEGRCCLCTQRSLALLAIFTGTKALRELLAR